MPAADRKRWLKMGVELEGAWDKPYRDVAAAVKGAQGKEDGSVTRLTGYRGEITTRPHTDLDQLCEDIMKLYPDRVNETCGFHIHTSFPIIDYSALTDKRFYEHYLDRWSTWGRANEGEMDELARSEFWDRWHGRGDRARRFCKREFKPDGQLVDHNDRYTQLNFTAYHKYQTLESRLLPMFGSRDIAVAAVREMAAIYDSYLNAYNFPKIEFETEFKTEGKVAVEEKLIKMPDYKAWAAEYEEKAFKPIPVGEDVFYSIRGAVELMHPHAERVNVEEP